VTAEFLSGGEVPIPLQQQDEAITVQFKPFGVSLRFTPYVLSENRIRIEVQPEVSTRNDADGVPIGAGGAVVPSFDVRRASTTVELAPGESFMIAGLLEDTLDSTIDQLPGVNEIPIFSSLFRSTTYDREESELVIAVTPYLVDPLKSNDVRMPTDDFRPASFMESVFYGSLGSLQGNVRRISQTPTMEGPIGFMVD
jgi:Flp pilus assembly protein, secretin CpaC